MAAATYYDHAKNHVNVADACAIAKVRREDIAENKAFRVEANWPGKPRFYWNGGRYDVLGLAKSLLFNRAENVIMTNPAGAVVDIAAARY